SRMLEWTCLAYDADVAGFRRRRDPRLFNFGVERVVQFSVGLSFPLEHVVLCQSSEIRGRYLYLSVQQCLPCLCSTIIRPEFRDDGCALLLDLVLKFLDLIL